MTRRPRYRPVAVALSLSVATVFLAGCAHTPEGASTAPAPAIVDLKRGMTPQEVEALLGKPAEISEPRSDGSGPIVVWVYRRNVGSRVDAVAPQMMEEPWVDPITGILYFLERPAQSERRVDFIEELHLYFASGQLAEANRTVKRQYQFSP